jgi:DNA-binding Lrp family transcriptional regulator
MDAQTLVAPTRRPRFRRASEPPAFRLTDDDVHIVRQLARHRFLKSTHIAALVGRSLDRTNDRLLRLFHAGYIDRPRAQLDYYPTAGSSPIAYALADRGARLLIERDGIAFANVEWSRKNRKAGRPFIEHQLEIVDFSVALQLATGARRDVQFIHPNDIIAAFPEQTRAARNPLSLRVKLSHQGAVHEVGLVPDLVFGLQFADGSAIPLWPRSTGALCPSPAPIFCKRASSGKCAPISPRMPGNNTRSISDGRPFACSP